MINKSLTDLQEVFVPFETVRPEGGIVIYYNQNLKCSLSQAQVLPRYSYVIANNSCKDNSQADKKIFFAERYGGDGILTNGGGGRCGFDGDFQLKGIGPNQLVGVRQPDAYGNSHGNGFLSLNTAIYESIWAEIINIALPYGAVRTVAIIDSETDFEEPDQTHPRGLLVRMPAVRPAHFIRAIYFKEKKLGILSEDAKRVSAAVQKLAYFLPQKENIQETISLDERLASGMIELAVRYARQFAAARAKRIFHQSISASNVTLDGAWMDLAGASVFSERLWWEGFNLKRFLMEYIPATESIREMCYYLRKYNVINTETSNSIFDRALSAFKCEYEKNLFLYNAVQAGFPLVIIERLVENPAFLEFSRCLQEILTKDNFSVTSIRTSSGWEGYEHWISRLYIELLKQKSKNNGYDFSWICKDNLLLSKLISAYNSFFDLAFCEAVPFGVSRESFNACLAINTTRLNRYSSLLVELHERISETRERARASGESSFYTVLINDAVRAGVHAFSCDRTFDLLLWESDTTTIRYDALTGLFTASSRSDFSSTTEALADMKLHMEEMKDILSFYNGVSEFIL
ncbi:hypothetical protein [Pseudomonas chlororaphis]|uniref:hypothetical protein n=1 Tax=Pseudomonas chlororaphis TaxID=587753 RepID=UPI0024078106|nr:hypothetical protein [Pseudomonas chlororaphis]